MLCYRNVILKKVQFHILRPVFVSFCLSSPWQLLMFWRMRPNSLKLLLLDILSLHMDRKWMERLLLEWKTDWFLLFQVLGYFSSLLYPPASVIDAANSAARKAASFISSGKNERNIVGGGSHVDTSIRAGMFLFLINDNLIDEHILPIPSHRSRAD